MKTNLLLSKIRQCVEKSDDNLTNLNLVQAEKKVTFIKIVLAYPRLIAAAKRLLDRREVTIKNFSDPNHTYAAYEANIDFEIRFMADTKVVGCNWIELEPGKHRLR